jgi:hypothetical protein
MGLQSMSSRMGLQSNGINGNEVSLNGIDGKRCQSKFREEGMKWKESR